MRGLVDVIAEILPKDTARLVRAFRRRRFQVAEEDIEDALVERGHFSVFDEASEYRLDCRGAYTDFERLALAERRRVRIDRSFVYIDSPANLIVAKLAFGSEQDILDAEAVYARQRPHLDLRQVAARARDRGVLREWKDLQGRVDAVLDAE
ncbi:MAG: hypothetical protein ACE5KQ_06775 [Thermoplasmata archaeon]